MTPQVLFAKPAWWFAGACATLLLVLFAEWLPSGEPSGVAVRIPAQHARPHGVPAASGSDSDNDKDTDSWAETITARPLFTIGRRPPKAASNRPSAASGLPRLSGIIVTRFSRRAIFMPDGGKPIVLAEGANLDEDTVRLIATDHVVLAGPKGDMTIYPSFDHNRTVPAPVLPPSGPMFRGPGGVGGPNGFIPRFVNGEPNPALNQSAGQGAAQNSDDDDNDDSGSPPPAFNQGRPQMPGAFRNPMIPRGRPQ
jgi:hypothetical protein